MLVRQIVRLITEDVDRNHGGSDDLSEDGSVQLPFWTGEEVGHPHARGKVTNFRTVSDGVVERDGSADRRDLGVRWLADGGRMNGDEAERLCC